MGCKIIFAPEAISDLENAVRYIARDNPEAALRVGNALIGRVAILEHFPLIGSPYQKRPGIRKLVCHPYIVFYRPLLEENRIEILRYWHGAQGGEPLRDSAGN